MASLRDWSLLPVWGRKSRERTFRLQSLGWPTVQHPSEDACGSGLLSVYMRCSGLRPTQSPVESPCCLRSEMSESRLLCGHRQWLTTLGDGLFRCRSRLLHDRKLGPPRMYRKWSFSSSDLRWCPSLRYHLCRRCYRLYSCSYPAALLRISR